MKIPYVKIYTADLLATSRKLTPEQIGQAILGLCEQAFENETAYQPQSQAERALFDMLVSWKQESIAALKQKKNAGRSGAKKRWQKEREKAPVPFLFFMDALDLVCRSADHFIQTETDTDTE